MGSEAQLAWVWFVFVNVLLHGHAMQCMPLPQWPCCRLPLQWEHTAFTSLYTISTASWAKSCWTSVL